MATPATATTDGESARPTRIAVACAGGRARITDLVQGEFIAAKPLQITGNCVRLALIGVNMAILAGDLVDLQVCVDDGVILEVIEPTGLVAYDAQGRSANWRARLVVGEGAILIWHGAPFVAARGSNVHRSTELALASGGRALINETLVLGRTAERGVCLHSQTAVSRNGQPLLVENLKLDENTHALPGIVAPSKVVGTVMAVGWRPRGDPSDPHRLDLAGPGSLFRTLRPAMHQADDLVRPWFGNWRRELLSPESDRSVALTAASPSSGNELGTRDVEQGLGGDRGPAERVATPSILRD